MQNVFLAPFFGQKIFINNLILIGSNPVIVLLLYISSPSCWPSRHHQHFFSCGLKHLLLASRLPCIQRLQLKWLMSQLAASLPLPTNYLTPWTFSLRSLELLLLLPLLPPPVPALVGNSWMFATKMKSCFPNGHSWSHIVCSILTQYHQVSTITAPGVSINFKTWVFYKGWFPRFGFFISRP